MTPIATLGRIVPGLQSVARLRVAAALDEPTIRLDRHGEFDRRARELIAEVARGATTALGESAPLLRWSQAQRYRQQLAREAATITSLAAARWPARVRRARTR
jgi:hypothetical protein